MMIKNKLQEKLFRKNANSWLKANTKDVFSFCEDYKDFLFSSKTERTATKTIVKRLEKAGFSSIEEKKTLKAGDKVYYKHKNKSVIACVIGKDVSKFRLVGSHIDSPRLDLKPNPVYETASMALLRSHYYGGIKKYQWTNVDLSMLGIMTTREGKTIEFNLGEDEGDSRFIISDLLPHLGRKRMEKPASEVVEGEELNLFIGSIPINEQGVKEKVKLNILNVLHEKYGIYEEDFAFAEINFVPSGKPTDIGFDRSMIAGYAHDDKSCSYANLMALLTVKTPSVTAISYFADKEEIGSNGNTGAESLILWDFSEILIEKCGAKTSAKRMLSNSQALSADVGAALNPNFQEVHEKQNAPLLGHGIIIEKYTGRGGKYSANDTHAEYLAEIRQILIKNSISWQTGELGKIDIGGGGTIAMYLSRLGIETVDAGPCVLGMHSPREVISKVGLYESYKLYKAFLE